MDLKSRTFFTLLSTLCAAPAFGAGSDDADSNRLVVEATKLVESAERASSGAHRRDFYRRANARLLQILSNHPDSSIAVKLATDRNVGSLSFDQIEGSLDSAGPCDDPLEEAPVSFDCMMDRAKRAGARADDLKESGGIRQMRAFDEDKRWKLEAELAKAEATAGELSAAVRRLDALEEKLPFGERRTQRPGSWRYLDAVGPVACKLARAGYHAESRARFRRGVAHALESYSPRSRLRSIAKAQACAGQLDDALDTAEKILSGDGSDGARENRATRIRTIAEIAEAALDDGEVERAASILDDLLAGASPANFDGAWSDARGAVVGALARLGLAHAREGDRRAATAAFERALDAASDGGRSWVEIGKAAVENRECVVPSRRPVRRARETVGNLVTIATAMHAAGGMEKKASLVLEHAVRAAGEEPEPLAVIAAASFRIEGRDAGQRALAHAEKALAADARTEAWQPFMFEVSSFLGPRCRQDYQWFERTRTFELRAEQEDSLLPPCVKGYAVADRVALAAAYLAAGDRASVEHALCCRLSSTIAPDPYGWYWHASAQAVPVVAKTGLEAASNMLQHGTIWKDEQLVELGRRKIESGALVVWEASEWKRNPPAAVVDDLGKWCSECFEENCVAAYTNTMTGRHFMKSSPRSSGGALKLGATLPATFLSAPTGSAPWNAAAVDPGYADALRAELARKLVQEIDVDLNNAVRIASGIADPNRRAEEVTELASLQVKYHRFRDARATLARASAAVNDIPEDLSDAEAWPWPRTKGRATIQDRAIRFARIAQVLAEMLPYE